MNERARYILGLGANLGSRRASLEAALELLGGRGSCRVLAVSSLYETDPVGPPQPRYLNAAARIESALEPGALLRELLAVEAELGRVRRERLGPRTLDLDLLWGPCVIADAELELPHPRLLERSFALAPLLEVAPELGLELGARLRALGGPPAPRLAWDPLARSVAEGSTPALAYEFVDASKEDATAAALAALGRRLGTAPTCGVSEARVLRGRAARGGEFAALVRGALREAANDFEFRCATVCELANGSYDARLLGRARTSKATRHGLELAALEPVTGAYQARWRLLPEAEDLAFLPQIPDG